MAHEPTAPLRILLVNSSSGLGGAETHVGQLARGLVQRGHEVHVASPADGPLVDAVLAAGAHHHPAPMYPDRPSWRQVKRLASLMREVAPEVLHLHGVRAGLLGRMALPVGGVVGVASRIGPRRRTMHPSMDGAAPPTARGRATRPAVVYTVHGAHFLHYRPPLDTAYARLERALQSITDQVIFVCRSDMEACIAAGAFDGRRGTVIHNGIAVPVEGPATTRAPLRDGLGLPATGPLVLAVGRLSGPKDYPTMLGAAARCAPVLRRLGAHVVIAGDGPEGPDLRALAERLELTGSPGNADPLVRFLGSRSDVPGLLRAADVLLLTSRWEGLPYAVLEAMAAGVPLVATRVGGIPELVVDGATGVVAEPGDTEGIAAALMRLLGDRALRSRLGAEAKRRSRRLFSEARMVDATAVVYRAALSRAPRRTRS